MVTHTHTHIHTHTHTTTTISKFHKFHKHDPYGIGIQSYSKKIKMTRGNELSDRKYTV